MGETFLININCSKVLSDSDETHYTMFIDSTKMSIVYELVEWIRWIFSLENCLYITHDNSAIHELEDIQVLSRLKNFEVKPCGGTHCVHKRMYRILLKNLNLFVSWNGIEVHKYFLHKLNQMDEKLSQGNITSPVKYVSGYKSCQESVNFKNAKPGNNKNISSENNKLFSCDNKLPQTWKDNVQPVKKTLTDNLGAIGGINGDSPTKTNCSFDKKISYENFFSPSQNKINYLDDSSCATTTGSSQYTSVNNAPVSTVKEQSKTCHKYSKKYVKPFSLGEVLSNLRAHLENQEEIHKKIKEEHKKNSPSLIVEEENFNESTMNKEDTFISENNINEGKKRKRTRKRKKSKREDLEKEEITPSYLHTKVAAFSLDSFKTGNIKPNHIRFEDDDNLMETESVEDEQNILDKNMYEVKSEQINGSTPTTFLKTNLKELTTVKMDNNQDLSELYQTCSLINNTENIVQDSSIIGGQTPAEEKLIDLDSTGNSNQASGGVENFESNNCKPDLNTLLSLKEKFKNAVVLERFY